MKALWLWMGILLLTSAVLATARAATVEELQRRVEALEAQQDELIANTPSDTTYVRSFLRNSFSLGGFYEAAVTGITGPDTKTQVTGSSNLLGFNISVDFADNLRFVSQLITGLTITLQNPNNDPRAVSVGQPMQRSFGTPLFGALPAQGYLEYSFSDNYRLQGGLGYVPFGYSFQLREPVLFARRGGPQMSRVTSLVNPLWSGFNLIARFPRAAGAHWGYNLYSITLSTNLKTPAYGGRVWMTSPQDKITTGLSTQLGNRYGRGYQIVGADARYDSHPWVIASEYVRQFSSGPEAWSAYVEPALYVAGDWLLVYVHGDYADSQYNVTTGISSIDDPFRKWEYGGGINWLPTAFTRVRLGVSQNDYAYGTGVINGQNRDYTVYDASVGVAF